MWSPSLEIEAKRKVSLQFSSSSYIYLWRHASLSLAWKPHIHDNMHIFHHTYFLPFPFLSNNYMITINSAWGNIKLCNIFIKVNLTISYFYFTMCYSNKFKRLKRSDISVLSTLIPTQKIKKWHWKVKSWQPAAPL